MPIAAPLAWRSRHVLRLSCARWSRLRTPTGPGGWDAGRVRTAAVTEPRAAEQRVQLVAFVPVDAMPDGPFPLQNLLDGSLVTSPFLQLVVTPVEVELLSMTDADGLVVFSEDRPVPRRQVSPMRLARDVGRVEFIVRNQSEHRRSSGCWHAPRRGPASLLVRPFERATAGGRLRLIRCPDGLPRESEQSVSSARRSRFTGASFPQNA